MTKTERLIKRLNAWWWPYRAGLVKELGRVRDPVVIPHLIRALNNGGPQARINAVRALGQWQRIEAVKALVTASKDPNWHVRKAAVTALGKVPDPNAVTALIHSLADDEIEIQYKAQSCLHNLGSQVTDQLLKELDNSFWKTRETALDILLRNPDQRLFQRLIPMALTDTNPDLRQKALDTLIKNKVPLSEPITAALKEEDFKLRVEAARIMGSISDDWIVAPLTAALQDSHKEVRAKSVWALGQRHAAQCYDHILERIKDDNNDVRKEALAALGQSKRPEAVPHLIAALEDRSMMVAGQAASVLGKLGAKEAADHLYAKAQVPVGIWDTAAVALAEIGDWRAVELLLDLSEYQTQMALDALFMLQQKLPESGDQLLCHQCFCRSKRYKPPIRLVKAIEGRALSDADGDGYDHGVVRAIVKAKYYLCRNCDSNLYLLEYVSKVVLLMNHQLEERYTQSVTTVNVNWYQKQDPFDYDEIIIMEADDYEIEKLVMVLINDMDKTRQKRRATIPVRISPTVNLSPAKMNLLKDHFLIKPL